MKHIFIALLLIIKFSFSQNYSKQEEVVLAFKVYSKTINSRDFIKHLSFFSPKIFDRTNTKEHALKYLNQNVLMKNDSVVSSRFEFDEIKNVSKSIKINKTEYKFIDYIHISRQVFTQTFIEKSIEDGSIYKINGRKIKSKDYKIETDIHSIYFDFENRTLLEVLHERVIVIKKNDSDEWKFIPQRLIFGIGDIDYRQILRNVLPKKIYKKIIKKTGYNTTYK